MPDKMAHRIAAALDYLVDQFVESDKLSQLQWIEGFEMSGDAPSIEEGFANCLLPSSVLYAMADSHRVQWTTPTWEYLISRGDLRKAAS